MSNITYYTKEGLARLHEELEELKTSGRIQVAKQLAEAREKGDLSENAEYEAAKDAQAMLELKISKLEEALTEARILEEENVDTSKVGVLTKALVKNMKTGKEMTFTLVSEKESDLTTGKISVKSPIGQGLLGCKVGEIVIIDVPTGKLEFKILKISV